MDFHVVSPKRGIPWSWAIAFGGEIWPYMYVQWGTNQNVVFEIAARKLSRLPTLKACRELKNWYFSTSFLPKNYP